MATPSISKLTSKRKPTDAGCIVLVVPFGRARSRRLILPHEVCVWLRDELGAAIADVPVQFDNGEGR